jgi:hypothetical protein
MKAERRHELQTNSLALWLRWKAPEVWAKYGTHILLGIIIIALGIVLTRHLMNKPIEEANRAADSVAAARQQIQEMTFSRQKPSDPQAIVTNIQQAMEQSRRPEIQAEGHLALGDYYWVLFVLPDLPTSQPTFVPVENTDELLAKAEENYNAALTNHASRPYVSARARFGLAAVNEARAYEAEKATDFKTPDEKHWAAAKEQYQAIIDDAGTAQVLKDEAKWHLDQLAEARKPVWLTVPPASTEPATTQTSPLGFTLPGTTRPAATRPATAPTK